MLLPTGTCRWKTCIIDEEKETKSNETTTLWKTERGSQGKCKKKGLGSYGKYGAEVATQDNRTKGDRRRQKMSTRVHAGQLGKVCRTYRRRSVTKQSAHVITLHDAD